jgi:putative MATE family efflux protein
MFSKQALRKLILPLFLDQLLLVLVSIVSTMLLSYAGEAAVSGVSLVEMVNVLLINILTAIAMGGAVVVAQFIGSQNMVIARKSAGQIVLITFSMSVLFMLIVLSLNGFILNILFGSVDPEVMQAARIYFILSSLSYPFLALYNTSAALFRSMGNSRIPMLASMFMNGMNIVGFYVAIFVLQSGIMGVAIATLLSRVLASMILVSINFNKNNLIYLEIKSILSWDLTIIKKILSVAIPNGIENGVTQFGRILLASIIALFGTAQITANGITNSLGMFAISYASAINFAIITVVGQCIGAKQFEQAEFYIRKLLKQAQFMTIIISITQILLLTWILNLYTISDEARQITFYLMILHNVMTMLIWPPAFTLSNGLRAAGDAKFTMKVSITAMLAFRITSAYILAIGLNLGVFGVYLSMGIDWIFRTFIQVRRLNNGKWKNAVLV